jgi:hypothetical protein
MFGGTCSPWARTAGVAPTNDVVIDGHGFALDATGCNVQAMFNGGTNLVTLKNVTLKGGYYDCACTHAGGGIQSNGDITAINAAVIGNQVTNTVANAADAFSFGGGIYTDGTVRLISSTVAQNLTRCEATCNTAASGGVSAGTLIATNSTISNNTADEHGFSSPPDPDSAGGFFATTATLTYSTVADNTASLGANLRTGGVLTSFASVIAHPLGGGDNCAVGSSTTSSGYNYEQTSAGSCGFGGGTGDLVQGNDVALGALGANGGVGQTRMPSSSSPLVEQIPPSACDDAGASTIVPLVDERGLGRPRGTGCDIGAVEAPAGSFTAVTPSRILDTRNGTGLSGSFTAQQTRSLVVGGAGPVPLNASAVLLNMTVTQPSAAGALTVYPADAALPTASNLNFKAAQTVPNLVVVKLGVAGVDANNIRIKNLSNGTVHVLADVMGYYNNASQSITDGFTGVTPTRVLDTRIGTGLPGAFTAQQTRSLTVGGVSGVPNDADAVVMNMTVTQPTVAGALTVFPADAALPGSSNLNFLAGQTVPNLVTVKIGTVGADDDKIKIKNLSAGTVHVIADVVGFYKSAVGGSLTPMTPTRILDTRNGTGGVTGPVAAHATVTVTPQTAAGMPAVGTYTAVVVNVTATQSSKAGFLTVFPSNASLPTASNLNFLAGQTVPNLVKINVGPDGKFKISNSGASGVAGTVQIIVDIVGYYTASLTA